MKKVLVMLLVLAMFASFMAMPAMADDTQAVDLSGTGVTLYYPQSFTGAAGVISSRDGGELGYNTGWYYAEVDYTAMSNDEYNALMEKEEPTEEEIENYYNNMANLFVIFAVSDKSSIEELAGFIKGMGTELDLTRIPKVGEGDGYSFYLYSDMSRDTSKFRPEYAEEFNALREQVPEIVAGGKFYAPVDPNAAMIGKKLSFKTTDINGNPVDSEELFAQHEITMLNVWTSWCHFCIEEMPELEAINGRIADKDCAVVGLLFDGNDPDALETGKGVLQNAGVTFNVILPPENAEELFTLDGYPTTFFVGRDGTILGAPVVGADVQAYEPAIDSLLAAGSSAPEVKPAGAAAVVRSAKGASDNGVTANDAGMYRVYVADENGKPVEKAKIQFCSDSECMLGTTDATGLATFEVPEGTYTVHVLKVPEGYAKDENAYTMTGYSDLSIVLKLA